MPVCKTAVRLDKEQLAEVVCGSIVGHRHCSSHLLRWYSEPRTRFHSRKLCVDSWISPRCGSGCSGSRYGERHLGRRGTARRRVAICAVSFSLHDDQDARSALFIVAGRAAPTQCAKTISRKWARCNGRTAGSKVLKGSVHDYVQSKSCYLLRIGAIVCRSRSSEFHTFDRHAAYRHCRRLSLVRNGGLCPVHPEGVSGVSAFQGLFRVFLRRLAGVLWSTTDGCPLPVMVCGRQPAV